MEIIPAVDIKGGRCVRLYQGEYAKETVFSNDPIGVALHWQEMGVPRLHVVDLDGAALGEPGNLSIIEEMARLVEVPLQVGGGIRTLATAQRVFDMGVDRVVLGTSAVENPHLLEEMCESAGDERVVVAVDALEGVVAIRGWQKETTVMALDLMKRMSEVGVRRFLYTDILRDGTLTEPNFQAIQHLLNTGFSVIASGGISSIEHIRRLAQMGVEGAVLGLALYTGDIQLKDAIDAGHLSQ